MTSASIMNDVGSRAAETDHPGPGRVRLRPPPPTGRVDGGWWPHSRNLAAELPALLAELQERLGVAERVSYNLDDWEPAESRISVRGSVVCLSGFHFQRRDTVDVLGARNRLTLLVLPPDTPDRAADDALTAAGRPGNDDIATLRPNPTRENNR